MKYRIGCDEGKMIIAAPRDGPEKPKDVRSQSAWRGTPT